MTIVLFGSSVINNPVVINDKLVEDLLVGGREMHLFLKSAIDLVQSFSLAPIVEGTGDVDVVSGIRPEKLSAQTQREAQDKLRQCASFDTYQRNT